MISNYLNNLFKFLAAEYDSFRTVVDKKVLISEIEERFGKIGLTKSGRVFKREVGSVCLLAKVSTSKVTGKILVDIGLIYLPLGKVRGWQSPTYWDGVTLMSSVLSDNLDYRLSINAYRPMWMRTRRKILDRSFVEVEEFMNTRLLNESVLLDIRSGDFGSDQSKMDSIFLSDRFRDYIKGKNHSRST